ncbi:hypothetical protein WMY93_010195 [Mugilogobius chulae]|uniref:Uncharacterized protein n=1 Tax=Mugilogobius chulae TaxID=88201 RepID=A0AAW0PI58_9GOBI
MQATHQCSPVPVFIEQHRAGVLRASGLMTDGVLTEGMDGPASGRKAREGVWSMALPPACMRRGTVEARGHGNGAGFRSMFLGATKSLKNRAAAGKLRSVPSQKRSRDLSRTGGNVSKPYTTQFTLASPAQTRLLYAPAWTFQKRYEMMDEAGKLPAGTRNGELVKDEGISICSGTE